MILSWAARLMAMSAAVALSTPVMAGERGELSPPSHVAEREKAPVTARDLVRLRDIGPATLSPEGDKIAFQLRRAEPDTNTYCIAMYVLDLHRRTPPKVIDTGGELITFQGDGLGFSRRPLGFPQPSVGKWSPDGRWIAFAKRVNGVTQIWKARADGQSSEAVTTSATDIEEFDWLPDSRRLTFATRPSLIDFRDGVRDEALRGYLYDERFIPMVSPTPQPRNLEHEYFTTEPKGLATRKATSGEIESLHRSDEHTSGRASVSAAGDRAWVDGAGANAAAGRLQVQLASGTTISCRAPTCADGVRSLWWFPDGKTVGYLRREGKAGSRSSVYRWRVGASTPVRLLATEDLVTDCLAFADAVLCASEGATRPRRLIAISTSAGKISTVFDPNPEFAAVDLQPAHRLYWRNDLGYEAFGDLVLPAGHRAGQKHPLIVVQYTSRGFLRGGTGDEYPIQLFAAHGFAVLVINRPQNYSGAQGRGARYRANNIDWADRRSANSSLEAGVDIAIAGGAIDPTRIGITGFSDGAATLEYALVNSTRYKVASVSALGGQYCFSALQGPAPTQANLKEGLPGLTDRGADAYWRRGSVAGNAWKVSAPLLIQVSQEEYLCPLAGYAALKELGRPVEMHVFPDEQHGKWQPAHRLAVYRRNVQWFDFWFSGVRDTNPVDPGQYDRWSALQAQLIAASRQEDLDDVPQPP